MIETIDMLIAVLVLIIAIGLFTYRVTSVTYQDGSTGSGYAPRTVIK